MEQNSSVFSLRLGGTGVDWFMKGIVLTYPNNKQSHASGCLMMKASNNIDFNSPVVI